MIIIADVHGHYKTLMALLDQIPQEEKDKGIVMSGDLVDRGPRSRQVMNWCIDNDILCVRGNHEQMVIDEGSKEVQIVFSGKSAIYTTSGMWLMNGGGQTMESYLYGGNSFDFDLFYEHRAWMKKLPYYLEFKDIKDSSGKHLVVSHSIANNVWNLRNSETGKEKFETAVLWNRPKKYMGSVEIFNVFGHTPTEIPIVGNSYVNIDTGVFVPKEKGYGRLTALQFPEMVFYTQDDID